MRITRAALAIESMTITKEADYNDRSRVVILDGQNPAHHTENVAEFEMCPRDL